jgi:hypothetical protein
MTNIGPISLFRPRFVLLLAGIVFLGVISTPLQAADNPPSAWSRIFGGETKEPEGEQKQSKPKKAKAEKSPSKTQKHTKSSKSNTSPSKNATTNLETNQEGSSAPVEKTTGITSPVPINSAPTGIGSFFQGIFGAASSSPLLKEDGNSPTEAPKPPSSDSVSNPTATNTPAATNAAPPVLISTSGPIPSESPKTESFWRRVFGGASSAPPDNKTEPSNPAPASAAPASTAQVVPTKEVTPATLPITTSSPSSTDEEPSFWQKLFGSKSGSVSNKKSGASTNKTIDKPAEPPQVSGTISPPTDTNLIVIPPNLTSATNTSESKANFGLVNVCEREKCELMILFDAPINKMNVEKFVQTTASIPAGTAILFNSIDGDLNSGIRLGQALRKKRFNARIGRTKLNKTTLTEVDGQCYSACVLAFSGGVNRRIDPNDQLGIYALRSNAKTVNENEMRAAVGGLGLYFEQMGIDRRLVDQMLQIKSTSVSLISLSNAKLLNLDNSSRATTYPWRLQALDDGLLIALNTEKQASGNFSITLGLTKQSKEFRLTVYIKPLSGTPNLIQLSDSLNRNSRLQMSFANQTIAPNLIKPWEPTGSGIQTAVVLSDKEIATISSTLEFELDFAQINRNTFNLDGVTIFGTSGLKGALTAIKK